MAPEAVHAFVVQTGWRSSVALLIYSAIATVLILITFGLGVLIVVPLIVIGAIAALVVIILTTMEASSGNDYAYQLTIRLIH